MEKLQENIDLKKKQLQAEISDIKEKMQRYYARLLDPSLYSDELEAITIMRYIIDLHEDKRIINSTLNLLKQIEDI